MCPCLRRQTPFRETPSHNLPLCNAPLLCLLLFHVWVLALAHFAIKCVDRLLHKFNFRACPSRQISPPVEKGLPCYFSIWLMPRCTVSGGCRRPPTTSLLNDVGLLEGKGIIVSRPIGEVARTHQRLPPAEPHQVLAARISTQTCDGRSPEYRRNPVLGWMHALHRSISDNMHT